MEATQGRERILLMGGFGVGKSRAWAKIAEWSAKRNGGTVYVLDTDMAAERMAVGFSEAFAAKVQYRDVEDWPSYREVLDSFSTVATKEDWLVVDLIDKAWSTVQSYFSDQVFNKGIESYFLEARKKTSDGGGFDGWTDWSVINKLYQAWMMKVLRWPGHVLCCTPAEQMMPISKNGKDVESSETRQLFGRFGVKPAGQKNLGFQFHTVLLLSQGNKPGEYWFNTIKDREREVVVKGEMKDFVASYLVPIGGWKL